MGEVRRIAAEIRAAHDGPAWHGSALAELLADVDAATAAARPIAEAHSIWEIVLHATGWTREVARRTRGGEPGLPEAGDWPEVAETTEAAWEAARADLAAAHRELGATLADFPDERLSEPVGSAQRDAPLGTGVSHRAMLHGLAQHDAYHGGQVALLKKAPRATAAPPEVGEVPGA